MKGVVFNMLEEVVSRDYGDDTWDALLEGAELDGVYTSLGNYPDEELGALVAVASRALSLSPQEVIRWFGHQSLPLFAQRYPALFEPHTNVRSFVLTLNEIIHPEVRKLYAGAQPPQFVFDVSSPDRLLMDYSSPRRLCAFAEGLIIGAGDHYGEVVQITQHECMNRGDERCRMEIATVQ